MDVLKEIEQYKKAVLLACAGAYLHNLGKVSKEFNLDHQKLLKENDQKQYYYYQHIVGLLKVDAIKAEINLNKEYSIDKKSIKHFGSLNDVTENVFKEIKNILSNTIFNNNKLFSPFDDCEYRWGDFIEYLGQGTDDARLYFNKNAKNNKQHREIMEKTSTGYPYYIELIRENSSLLTHLMNRCHDGASGGEKDNFYHCKQNKDVPVYQATPFGFESENADKDYNQYDTYRKEAEKAIKRHLSLDNNTFSLDKFISELKPTFQKALTDSQRPFNNISVHDIGHSGMAFFKSAIWTLKGKEFTHDSFWKDEGKHLRWRLLRFSLDGLDYLSEAVSIGDLRVRKIKLEQYLDKVKNLLEEQYPVATEVYRDENGSIFIFPDWAENSNEVKSIKRLINEKCGINSGDSSKYPLAKVYGLEPLPQISSERCVANPRDARVLNEPYIGKIMQEMILNPLSARPVLAAFKNKERFQADLCPYCGLRLIKNGKSSDKQTSVRKTCDVCLDERRGIAENWWKKERKSTIWLEEIADENGRLALIVGRFFPECFISLDYLPGERDNNGCKEQGMCSAEAFARQRRIWETCREFWQSIEQEIGDLAISAEPRLCITVKELDDRYSKDPSTLLKNQAYELVLDGKRFTAMWTEEKDFVIVENLPGFEKRNSLEEKTKVWLEKYKGEPITVRIPGSYGSKTAEWGQVRIDQVKTDDNKYISAMSVLTEPRTFMYLVPAQKALKVIDKIKDSYGKKMSQVRGRLPLRSGIVFADRYTTLRTILDAGRRMLNRQPEGVIAKIVQKDEDKNRYLFTGQIDGEKDKICWIFRKTVGDSISEDKWYSYLPVIKLDDKQEELREQNALDLDPYAEPCGLVPVNKVEKMINVNNVKEGDQFLIYPSTFDFEYLDNAGARFEIAYENRKRKSADKRHRPYLLEQFNELKKIWTVLEEGALNRNQIYALRNAIATKRQEWEPTCCLTDETFKQFCRDMLVTASWNKVMMQYNEKKYPWEFSGEGYDEFFEQWANYAVRGWFEDVVQLYLQIMKAEIGKRGRVNE